MKNARLFLHTHLSLLPTSRRFRGPCRTPSAETGASRQRRGSAKAGFLGTGQLALRDLHYIVAGESAGAWGDLG